MSFALDLAQRILRRHDLEHPPSVEQLLEICRLEGCRVIHSDGLNRPGYYAWTDFGPLIVLRSNPAPVHIAHELYHHLIRDLTEADLEAPESEDEAHLFAHTLCGPS